MIRLDELLSGKIPTKAELQKRDEGFFYKDEELFFLGQKEFEKKFNLTLEHQEIKNLKELQGEIAYPGVVRGKVCRVMGHQHFGKIKEGEIMVSPATMPDFLAAMKKAAAFVTDEGGTLSHTAIIAREMKKPCIVGCKVATQVLKDGDLVEVNAEKGIVKRIKE